jgi:ATP-binding cassette subfamily B protein
MNNDELKLKTDRKLPFKTILNRNLKYVKPELPSFLLAIILLLINVGLGLTMPLFMGDITNELNGESKFNFAFIKEIFKTDELINFKFILALVIIYFVISIINQVILYVESMLLQHVGQRVIYRMRMEVFSHIENMSQNQFNEMPVGSLVTRVCSYTASMSDLFTNVLVSVLKNLTTVVGVYAIMYFISWKLSLLMLIFVVIVFVTSLLFSKVSSKLFRAERASLSDLNTFLNENLSGIKLTQIFNQEERKLAEFDEKSNKYQQTRINTTFAFAVYRPFITLLYILAVATTFAFGLYIKLSAGEIVAFYMYLSQFFNPIQNLADQFNNIQKAFSASEKLINILDVEPEVLDADDSIEIEKFEGKIEFRNVWFAYKPDVWILKDVSFTINPKETCAFVGATGAGKTTILALIVRNYEIQKGQILIDGIDIKKIKMDSLRRAIGQMLQDVFLFSGSIKSNITLHDETFTNEEIKETCDYVNASSFIDKLERGVDEEVIERGENFSQGQRQLLSFARTVLHTPQILILDEATANIDTETEVLIQESLEKIKNIGTMLVVAHRLSTIQHADQIIVLQNGEIIERGNHQELLKQKGHYYKLYQLQFEQR